MQEQFSFPLRIPASPVRAKRKFVVTEREVGEVETKTYTGLHFAHIRLHQYSSLAKIYGSYRKGSRENSNDNFTHSV